MSEAPEVLCVVMVEIVQKLAFHESGQAFFAHLDLGVGVHYGSLLIELREISGFPN